MDKRIGIYGGAFNPPTFGHAHVVKSVLDTNLVDEIWIIPSFIHYHGKEMAPFSLRYEMCVRLFTEELNLGYDTDKVKILRVDELFSQVNPSYDGSMISMMERIRNLSDYDFRIIIGQDNADTISTWKNGSVLVEREKFITIPRPQTVPVNRDAGWYEYPPHTFLKDVKLLDMSSTKVRNLCKQPSTTLYDDTVGLMNTEVLLTSMCGSLVEQMIREYNLYTEVNNG